MNRQRIWRIKQSEKPETLDIYIYGYVEGDSEEKESKTSAEYFKKELEKHPDVVISICMSIAGVGKRI